MGAPKALSGGQYNPLPATRMPYLTLKPWSRTLAALLVEADKCRRSKAVFTVSPVTTTMLKSAPLNQSSSPVPPPGAGSVTNKLKSDAVMSPVCPIGISK